MFITNSTLQQALGNVYGTAFHLLKIWFALKHMGLSPDAPGIKIDTSNSTPSLDRLFSCGALDGRYYVPFAHTKRFLTMKHDAARSIIQTTIQRWGSSGSVVTCDPTEFLDIAAEGGTTLLVKTARRYPFGLGIGKSGFSLEDNSRVSIPLKSFAVWYGRKTDIPNEADPGDYLIATMLHELHMSFLEKELIFVDDKLEIKTTNSQLSDADIFSICNFFIEGVETPTVKVFTEEFVHYARRLSGMVSDLNAPSWLRTAPDKEVNDLLNDGAKSILMYGPPRTGKTRLINSIIKDSIKDSCIIQIHDGWGYDHLIEGFKPDSEGKWQWEDGPLKIAILGKKKFIILEEINRTCFSQSLGEVFSLIEDSYRGEDHGIILRSGHRLWISSDTVFLFTMNTIDKSTEEIDDALLGRISAVEFPPRAEYLNEMMTNNRIPENFREKISQLYAEIQGIYPLGHGYFAELSAPIDNQKVIRYYKARIRPVLMNFLGELKIQELSKVDNIVDEMFGMS